MQVSARKLLGNRRDSIRRLWLEADPRHHLWRQGEIARTRWRSVNTGYYSNLSGENVGATGELISGLGEPVPSWRISLW